jgi:uncharacterized membrane protein YphA (DoxX/SURF4 family)
LLLLRAVLGVTAGMQGTFYFTGSGGSRAGAVGLGVLLAAAGCCILTGLLTRPAAALAGLVLGGTALAWLPLPENSLLDSRLAGILTACVAAALVLLGPGALSLDAKLFGRREIIIPPVSRRPGL